MKVTFEGSDAEIAKIVLAAFGSTQSAVLPMAEVVEVAAEPAAAESAPVGAAQNSETVESSEGPQQSIRSRVLGLIIKYPSMTINEIASTLGLDFEQVRAPVRYLMGKNFVDVAKGPDKLAFQPHRLIPTKTSNRAFSKMSVGRLAVRRTAKKRAAVGTREIVSDYLRANPGATSTQVAKALGMAPNNISAALTTMNKIGAAKADGAGGASDPYRYSLAEA